jgi:hypothetical protein
MGQGRGIPVRHVWLGLLVLAGLLLAFPRRLGEVYRIEVATGQLFKVTLPWFGHEQPGPYRFEATLLRGASKLTIRAVDYLELLTLNGERVFATQPAECLHCAYNDFPLPKVLAQKGARATFITRRVLRSPARESLARASSMRLPLVAPETRRQEGRGLPPRGRRRGHDHLPPTLAHSLDTWCRSTETTRCESSER